MPFRFREARENAIIPSLRAVWKIDLCQISTHLKYRRTNKTKKRNPQKTIMTGTVWNKYTFLLKWSLSAGCLLQEYARNDVDPVVHIILLNNTAEALKQTPNATHIFSYMFLFLYLSNYFTLITLFDNSLNMTALIECFLFVSHGQARAFQTKTGNHVARGIGGYYLVTTCVIQLFISWHQCLAYIFSQSVRQTLKSFLFVKNRYLLHISTPTVCRCRLVSV